ncbi:hypothetical protein DPMN_069447 [Dreissena polymorpha]|uniref:Uncharacterized protein n=1 Tax=Dreissena polymorpha TaxID=45954 RepID=A0A9D4BN31_DREPO|nr:hypothetical protein DPMN_069447 [Dreissena polymorpha]
MTLGIETKAGNSEKVFVVSPVKRNSFIQGTVLMTYAIACIVLVETYNIDVTSSPNTITD